MLLSDRSAPEFKRKKRSDGMKMSRPEDVDSYLAVQAEKPV